MKVKESLIARLEAACKLIDSLDKMSIASIRFVAEQARYIRELRDTPLHKPFPVPEAVIDGRCTSYLLDAGTVKYVFIDRNAGA